METKKSTRADLEPKRNLFLQAGLIFALSATLVAFEWKSPIKSSIQLRMDNSIATIDEIINPTIQDLPKPKPAPVSLTRITLVDDEKLTLDYDPIDAEITENQPVPEYIPVNIGTVPEEGRVNELEPPFISVEKMPEFPGGEEALKKYLAENTRFPEAALQAGISGIVYLSFIIEKDGIVSNVKILRGIGGGCDEMAYKVISEMPRWEPGQQQMKPVRVLFSIPIAFKFRD